MARVLLRPFALSKIQFVRKPIQDASFMQKYGFAKTAQQPSFRHATEDKDQSMNAEIQSYELGKRWLAKMMGENVETFTQKDVDEAIKYLLPSGLFAKDARPMFKHPSDIFPQAKHQQFDRGRPIMSGFYTGFPKFYDLTYDIWKIKEMLSSPKPISYESLLNENTDDFINKEENKYEKEEAKRMQWMRKFQLEDKLQEKINDKQYDLVLFRLKKLSSHPRADEIQHFLQQFQVHVATPGKEELKDVEVYDGAARSMGYRKSAIAEVVVKEGTGIITVNNKPLLDYFFLPNDREQIMYPLIVIDELDRFDIETNVIGGGHSGKSGAIRLGISRAIAGLCPEYFDALNEQNLLIRDMRFRERKKPGRRGARRAFQWVKR